MPRVKRGVTAHAKHKKVLKKAPKDFLGMGFALHKKFPILKRFQKNMIFISD